MLGRVTLRAVAQVPAKDTGCADYQDGEEVEKRSLETRGGFLGWCDGVVGLRSFDQGHDG